SVWFALFSLAREFSAHFDAVGSTPPASKCVGRVADEAEVQLAEQQRPGISPGMSPPRPIRRPERSSSRYPQKNLLLRQNVAFSPGRCSGLHVGLFNSCRLR